MKTGKTVKHAIHGRGIIRGEGVIAGTSLVQFEGYGGLKVIRHRELRPKHFDFEAKTQGELWTTSTPEPADPQLELGPLPRIAIEGFVQ